MSFSIPTNSTNQTTTTQTTPVETTPVQEKNQEMVKEKKVSLNQREGFEDKLIDFVSKSDEQVLNLDKQTSMEEKKTKLDQQVEKAKQQIAKGEKLHNEISRFGTSIQIDKFIDKETSHMDKQQKKEWFDEQTVALSWFITGKTIERDLGHLNGATVVVDNANKEGRSCIMEFLTKHPEFSKTDGGPNRVHTHLHEFNKNQESGGLTNPEKGSKGWGINLRDKGLMGDRQCILFFEVMDDRSQNKDLSKERTANVYIKFETASTEGFTEKALHTWQAAQTFLPGFEKEVNANLPRQGEEISADIEKLWNSALKDLKSSYKELKKQDKKLEGITDEKSMASIEQSQIYEKFKKKNIQQVKLADAIHVIKQSQIKVPENKMEQFKKAENYVLAQQVHTSYEHYRSRANEAVISLNDHLPSFAKMCIANLEGMGKSAMIKKPPNI